MSSSFDDIFEVDGLRNWAYPFSVFNLDDEGV